MRLDLPEIKTSAESEKSAILTSTRKEAKLGPWHMAGSTGVEDIGLLYYTESRKPESSKTKKVRCIEKGERRQRLGRKKKKSHQGPAEELLRPDLGETPVSACSLEGRTDGQE